MSLKYMKDGRPPPPATVTIKFYGDWWIVLNKYLVISGLKVSKYKSSRTSFPDFNTLFNRTNIIKQARWVFFKTIIQQ